MSFQVYGFNFSAVSDNWWDACHIQNSGAMIAIAETYRRTIHFDSIATIFCILLLILPLLFKIYKFGQQLQLKSFYNKLYSAFNFYQVLLGLMTQLTAILHLFINQQPACINWDRNQISYNLGELRNPNLDLIISVLLAEALISYKMNLDSIKQVIAKIASFTIAIVFVLLDAVAKIYAGSTNISGVVETIALGIWVIYYAKFVPPLFLCITCGFVTLLNIIAICVSTSLHPGGIDVYALKDSYYIAFRGLFVSVISMIAYINHAFSIEDFNWFGSDWDKKFVVKDSDSDSAEIPKIGSQEVKTDFGNVLNRDLIVGFVCFILYLFGNWGISVFPKYAYSFFN